MWPLILDWYSSVLFIDAPCSQAVVCSTWFTPGHITKVKVWYLLTYCGNTPSPLHMYDSFMPSLKSYFINLLVKKQKISYFLLLWSHHRDYLALRGCPQHICFARAYVLELFSLLCDGPCFLSVDVRLCVVQIACTDRNHPVAMASCGDNSHRMN